MFDEECNRRNAENSRSGAKTPTPYENLGRRGVIPEQFIGREQEIRTLHELLQQNAQVAITAAVTGMGGVGKTELAIQYARNHLSTYQGGVCWFPARDFPLNLVEFARPRFFPNINFDRFSLQEQVAYCWQNWAKGEALLVLDDVTNYQQQVQLYLPESPRFKVLITTRKRLRDKKIALLDLEVLTPANSLELLKLLLGNERVERELDIAAELCKWLGYLPLGLELVGRYLDEEPLSLAQMLERLKQKRLKHPALEETNPMMTAQLGVIDAFELSWDRLDEKAQQLGCLLSLFALAAIPWELVEGVYHCFQGDGFESEDLEKPRKDLIKFHLFKTDKETYSLHQLIREFFREKLEGLEQADEMKQAFAVSIVAVAKQIADPIALTRELLMPIAPVIPHLQEVANHLTTYLSNEDLGTSFLGLGRFYEGQGVYVQAEPWYEKCLCVVQANLGETHPAVTESLNNLASIYLLQGRYSEAEPKYQQALELLKRFGENKSLNLAYTLRNLAHLYTLQGRYDEAEPVALQALELFKLLQGDEHTDIALILNNLGEIYRRSERYSEAESPYLQALKLRRHLLGNDDIRVATSLNNLAELYRDQRRYSEAEPLYLESLELHKRLLGDDHQYVAVSLGNLGRLYEAQSHYGKAVHLFAQALEIFERKLGSGHPYTVKCRNYLVTCLRQVIRENGSDLEALRDNPLVREILDE